MSATDHEPADPGSALSILRSQSLSSAVEREIERMILNRDLSPGERVNEVALASRLGISRGPVREACRALAAAGLLTAVPNRGVFVTVLDERGVEELYEMRAVLSAGAGRLLAERITPAMLAELTGLHHRMEDAARAGDLSAYYPLNVEFHRAIVRMTGNTRLMAAHEDVVRQQHLFRAMSLVGPRSMAASSREHAGILAALAARDAAAAQEALTAHVNAGRARMADAERDTAAAEDAAAGAP